MLRGLKRFNLTIKGLKRGGLPSVLWGVGVAGIEEEMFA